MDFRYRSGTFVPSDAKIAVMIAEAVQKKDSTICERLPKTKGLNSTPRNDCVFAIAVGTNNHFMCRSRPFDTACVEKIAIAKADPTICDFLLKTGVSESLREWYLEAANNCRGNVNQTLQK